MVRKREEKRELIQGHTRCINDQSSRPEPERKREEERGERNTGATVARLGLAVLTPVRPPYVLLSVSFPGSPYFDSQSDGVHTVCYRMLPNRGESSSVVTKPRDYRGGWSTYIVLQNTDKYTGIPVT